MSAGLYLLYAIAVWYSCANLASFGVSCYSSTGVAVLRIQCVFFIGSITYPYVEIFFFLCINLMKSAIDFCVDHFHDLAKEKKKIARFL